jgi:phage terminase small subunit
MVSMQLLRRQESWLKASNDLIVNMKKCEIKTLIWWTNQQWEDIDDVGYKVALHGHVVKVRQDSTTMDHARVKGNQEAWHWSTKDNGWMQLTNSKS